MLYGSTVENRVSSDFVREMYQHCHTIRAHCDRLAASMNSLFHADPHRGNLLRTPNGDLAVIDFGMMVSRLCRQKWFNGCS